LFALEIIMTKNTETIVVRITGDSGDGVQIVGEQLTITAALQGRDVRSSPNFPAEIRAPAGSVAGVSGFQLAMSQNAIFTAGETLDVLVALNPAALKNSLPYLQPHGLLILNEDSMQAKDWEKAGCDPSLLQDVKQYYQVVNLPLITYTIKALEELNLTHAQAKKAKNFYVLGLVLWLFDLSTEQTQLFIQKKFKNQVALANEKALMAGYNYAMTLELSRSKYIIGQVSREPGEYRQLTGVEAVAMAIASVAVGTKTPLLVSGYPITPASAILHECVRLEDYGVRLLQAEDEISAICACIGAAFGGCLALTCTSGPGLDLKSESLGLAVVAELPLVVLDVQRAGASTGMPTKTGQSDLRQALYGRHGEAPLPVISPKSPSDCFYAVIDAFRIAIKYMTPVIVLLDADLAISAQPWSIPDPTQLDLPVVDFNRYPKPYQRDEYLSRSWNVPGTPNFIHQIGGLEKQGEDGRVSYDAKNHQDMVNLRAKKIAGIARDYPALTIEGDATANILIVGWGSTHGSLQAAITQCQTQGLSVALLHLRYLNPLPDDLGEILSSFSKVFVAELNTGHLYDILRAKYLIDCKLITQCNGQPFSTSFLVNTLQQELTHEHIYA
jgi:2-oxoglutarate/2-oxoacid ferredoxin oxidoreductase subunit alpha